MVGYNFRPLFYVWSNNPNNCAKNLRSLHLILYKERNWIFVFRHRITVDLLNKCI